MAEEREPAAGPPPQGTMPLTPVGAGKRGGTPPDKLLGQVVDGRYRLRALLGEGGMGRVYLAEDDKLNRRRVALKLMGPALTMDAEFRARFHREAVLQANLPHPQIVQVIDIGEGPEGAYIVMEYSDGRALSTLLRELGPRPLDRALDITEQLLETLDFAHRQGVVHRDLKPSNILIEQRAGREFVRVLDFGIAKLMTAEGADLAVTLTKAGHAYGTLGYMAPEQAKGEVEKLDHRADIYAVGIILYEMLTGQVPAPPEARTHPVRYAMWVAGNPVRPLRESHPDLDVAEEVDKMLRSALRRDPDKRYPSALAFLNAIRQFRKACDVSTVRRAPVDAPAGGGSRAKGTTGSATAPANRSLALGGWVLALLFAAAGALGWWQWSQLRARGIEPRPAGGDEAALAELAAARKAAADAGIGSGPLDAAVRTLAERARTPGDPAAATRLSEMQKRAEDAEAKLEAARKEADARLGDANPRLTELEGKLAAAEKRANDANGDVANAKRELQAATGQLSAAREELERVKRERDAAVAGAVGGKPPAGVDADALKKAKADLDAEKQRADQLAKDLLAQVTAVETAERRATAAENERKRVASEVEALRLDAQDAKRERDEAAEAKREVDRALKLAQAGISEKDERIRFLEARGTSSGASPDELRRLGDERDAARRESEAQRQRGDSLQLTLAAAERERDRALERLRSYEGGGTRPPVSGGGTPNSGGGSSGTGGGNVPAGTGGTMTIKNNIRGKKLEINYVRVRPRGGQPYDVQISDGGIPQGGTLAISIPVPGDITVNYTASAITGAKGTSRSLDPVAFQAGGTISIDF